MARLGQARSSYLWLACGGHDALGFESAAENCLLASILQIVNYLLASTALLHSLLWAMQCCGSGWLLYQVHRNYSLGIGWGWGWVFKEIFFPSTTVRD